MVSVAGKAVELAYAFQARSVGLFLIELVIGETSQGVSFGSCTTRACQLAQAHRGPTLIVNDDPRDLPDLLSLDTMRARLALDATANVYHVSVGQTS